MRKWITEATRTFDVVLPASHMQIWTRDGWEQGPPTDEVVFTRKQGDRFQHRTKKDAIAFIAGAPTGALVLVQEVTHDPQ